MCVMVWNACLRSNGTLVRHFMGHLTSPKSLKSTSTYIYIFKYNYTKLDETKINTEVMMINHGEESYYCAQN